MAIIASALAVVLVAGVIAIVATGCSKEESKRMTLDINPSIEFMLDKNNKVVSVSGLNDDGNVVIYGEAFIGKTAEEAVELAVSVSYETGYLFKGSVSGSANEVKISVSGDEGAAKNLYNKVSSKVSSYLKKVDVEASVSRTDALEKTALVTLAISCDPSITEDEANAMTEQELLAVVRTSRIETQALYMSEMKDAYNAAKNYQISFAEKEETKNIINGLGALYTVVLSGYNTALTSYQTLIGKIEQARYDYLIDPDSDYQKALASLLAKKGDFLEFRASFSVMTADEQNAAQAEFNIKLNAYEAAATALKSAGDAANLVIDAALSALKTGEAALVSVEKLFPTEITTALTNGAKDIENAANEVKSNFFATFETENADAIAAYNKKLEDLKTELKAA